MGKVISTVQVNAPKKQHDFPKLMRNNNGVIVLFLSPSKGTIVGHVYYLGDIGYQSESLIMDSFYDFDGEVTLKNC